MNNNTDTNTDALKPCPFCGDDKRFLVYHEQGTIIHPWYRIECDNCGAKGPGTDQGTHVEDWNRRAIDPEAHRLCVAWARCAADIVQRLIKFPPKDRNRIALGMVEGMLEITVPYPGNGAPPIQPAFDECYDHGYWIGKDFAKASKVLAALAAAKGKEGAPDA